MAGLGIGLIDTRALTKIRAFDGKESSWRDWSFQFESYCGLLSAALHRHMTEVKNVTTPLHSMQILQDDLAVLSRSMFFLLVQLVGGVAMTIVRGVEEQHGFEAWRRLCQHYEPQVATRTVGVLQTLLSPVFRTDSLQLWHEDFLKWESELRHYERDAQPLSDEVKVALVLARAPSSIADVLRIQASQFADDFPRL
eukprot:6463206-Amphidinium_carterae.1